MPDIIQLLPDNIANQIAAGEVIQRPASAVKEMLENAIDAGATSIHLIIKDAGKELIQVIDNGKGMSPTDARLCFERHATSKIKTIDDLFAINTMGFRGEALASIAAVAQVELKTKTHTDEAGTCIFIDNSTVKSQEPCQCETGSSIAIKNLFFNVPARRHFLKSNAVETRHIVDEFTRVAMAYPSIKFVFTNNNSVVFNIESGNLKQRILALLGNNLNAKLVPAEENTDVVSVKGFIGTPDAASKSRGSQYFFCNNRFIKSAYLNHAVSAAYRELLTKDEFPTFVLFITIDPARIDINVHPTKQEIKFDDEKIVYAFVNSAVKHALSKFSVAPSLDFNLDPAIESLTSINLPFNTNTQQRVKNDYLYQSFTERGQSHFLEKKEDVRNWKELYKIQDNFTDETPNQEITNSNIEVQNSNIALHEEPEFPFIDVIQLSQSYIIATAPFTCIFIDQHLAHQRILFEKYTNAFMHPIAIQALLHPVTIEFSPADAVILQEVLPDFLQLGYQIEPFGNHTFIIQGMPADAQHSNAREEIEQWLEQYKHSQTTEKLSSKIKLARSMAMYKAMHHGKKLEQAQMKQLITDLFACEQPQHSPIGKKIFTSIHKNDIENLIANAT
jgi:DNA mismatch repair protein MutL